jgi:hypothetical protein
MGGSAGALVAMCYVLGFDPANVADKYFVMGSDPAPFTTPSKGEGVMF